MQTDLAFKEINLVIGRISDCGLDVKKRVEGRKYIRETQVEFAEFHPRGAWVDTDDLNCRKDGYKVDPRPALQREGVSRPRNTVC